MQPFGAAKGDPKHGEQQQRRGQSKDQMHGDRRQPLMIDRRDIDACKCVNRIASELAKANAPRDAVDHRIDGKQAVTDAVRDGATQSAMGGKLTGVAFAGRKASEVSTVGANQSKEAAGRFTDQRVKILEIFRLYRDRDNAVEGTIGRFQPAR